MTIFTNKYPNFMACIVAITISIGLNFIVQVEAAYSNFSDSGAGSCNYSYGLSAAAAAPSQDSPGSLVNQAQVHRHCHGLGCGSGPLTFRGQQVPYIGNSHDGRNYNTTNSPTLNPQSSAQMMTGNYNSGTHGNSDLNAQSQSLINNLIAINSEYQKKLCQSFRPEQSSLQQILNKNAQNINIVLNCLINSNGVITEMNRTQNQNNSPSTAQGQCHYVQDQNQHYNQMTSQHCESVNRYVNGPDNSNNYKGPGPGRVILTEQWQFSGPQAYPGSNTTSQCCQSNFLMANEMQQQFYSKGPGFGNGANIGTESNGNYGNPSSTAGPNDTNSYKEILQNCPQFNIDNNVPVGWVQNYDCQTRRNSNTNDKISESNSELSNNRLSSNPSLGRISKSMKISSDSYRQSNHTNTSQNYTHNPCQNHMQNLRQSYCMPNQVTQLQQQYPKPEAQHNTNDQSHRHCDSDTGCQNRNDLDRKQYNRWRAIIDDSQLIEQHVEKIISDLYWLNPKIYSVHGSHDVDHMDIIHQAENQYSNSETQFRIDNANSESNLSQSSLNDYVLVEIPILTNWIEPTISRKIWKNKKKLSQLLKKHESDQEHRLIQQSTIRIGIPRVVQHLILGLKNLVYSFQFRIKALLRYYKDQDQTSEQQQKYQDIDQQSTILFNNRESDKTLTKRSQKKYCNIQAFEIEFKEKIAIWEQNLATILSSNNKVENLVSDWDSQSPSQTGQISGCSSCDQSQQYQIKIQYQYFIQLQCKDLNHIFQIIQGQRLSGPNTNSNSDIDKGAIPEFQSVPTAVSESDAIRSVPRTPVVTQWQPQVTQQWDSENTSKIIVAKYKVRKTSGESDEQEQELDQEQQYQQKQQGELLSMSSLIAKHKQRIRNLDNVNLQEISQDQKQQASLSTADTSQQYTPEVPIWIQSPMPQSMSCNTHGPALEQFQFGKDYSNNHNSSDVRDQYLSSIGSIISSTSSSSTQVQQDGNYIDSLFNNLQIGSLSDYDRHENAQQQVNQHNDSDHNDHSHCHIRHKLPSQDQVQEQDIHVHSKIDFHLRSDYAPQLQPTFDYDYDHLYDLVQTTLEDSNLSSTLASDSESDSVSDPNVEVAVAPRQNLLQSNLASRSAASDSGQDLDQDIFRYNLDHFGRAFLPTDIKAAPGSDTGTEISNEDNLDSTEHCLAYNARLEKSNDNIVEGLGSGSQNYQQEFQSASSSSWEVPYLTSSTSWEVPYLVTAEFNASTIKQDVEAQQDHMLGAQISKLRESESKLDTNGKHNGNISFLQIYHEFVTAASRMIFYLRIKQDKSRAITNTTHHNNTAADSVNKSPYSSEDNHIDNYVNMIEQDQLQYQEFKSMLFGAIKTFYQIKHEIDLQSQQQANDNHNLNDSTNNDSTNNDSTNKFNESDSKHQLQQDFFTNFIDRFILDGDIDFLQDVLQGQGVLGVMWTKPCMEASQSEPGTQQIYQQPQAQPQAVFFGEKLNRRILAVSTRANKLMKEWAFEINSKIFDEKTYNNFVKSSNIGYFNQLSTEIEWEISFPQIKEEDLQSLQPTNTGKLKFIDEQVKAIVAQFVDITIELLSWKTVSKIRMNCEQTKDNATVMRNLLQQQAMTTAQLQSYWSQSKSQMTENMTWAINDNEYEDSFLQSTPQQNSNTAYNLNSTVQSQTVMDSSYAQPVESQSQNGNLDQTQSQHQSNPPLLIDESMPQLPELQANEISESVVKRPQKLKLKRSGDKEKYVRLRPSKQKRDRYKQLQRFNRHVSRLRLMNENSNVNQVDSENDSMDVQVSSPEEDEFAAGNAN